MAQVRTLRISEIRRPRQTLKPRRQGSLRRIPAKPRPLISVEEAAEMLCQSRSSLYRSISRGELPLRLVTINGRYRIPLVAVERLAAGEGAVVG